MLQAEGTAETKPGSKKMQAGRMEKRPSTADVERMRRGWLDFEGTV